MGLKAYTHSSLFASHLSVSAVTRQCCVKILCVQCIISQNMNVKDEFRLFLFFLFHYLGNQ